MHQYPSDINREEYEQIREDLEGARKKTRPREYDLLDTFSSFGNSRKISAKWRHRGQGIPLQVCGMYIRAMLAPSPPGGGEGLRPRWGRFRAVK